MNIIPIGIWGGYPKANSSTSSFLVEEDGFHLLIDCGSGVLSSLQNYISIEKLDAVIITHYHHDHIADVGPLQFAKLIQNQLASNAKTLAIYADEQDLGYETLTYKNHTNAYPLQSSQRIGPFSIDTTLTNHPVRCLALRLKSKEKSVVFTADTGWQASLIPFCKNADLLVSEANLYQSFEGKISGHMSGRQAGELAAAAQAGQLILTHLPHFGELSDLVLEAKSEYKKDVSLAEVGKVYRI
ncbi:MBL fold metallo-hydrolase [Gracilibacillus kekensis]|uniref:Ribonuclease BN, tRNA processing enzyme n=1 Tax=Gracilibacillus kekensis TaxID=1027249 RepID=A0A1M7JER0_9BACI|nr:MBL fold metallo-hydrolase [Gracilibacillus kekensis]SHM51007.1 Ribonuclease BN, tRNA processing enzyme [Gracilibacillus kekensis]